MNADLNVPLSDVELDELAGLLTSDATQEEAMDISMLDGFLNETMLRQAIKSQAARASGQDIRLNAGRSTRQRSLSDGQPMTADD